MNPPASPRPGTEPRTPSDHVVHVVADERGISPMELPPLQDAVDADALNTIVESLETDTGWTPGSVTFNYGGCIVVVDGDGDVSVSRRMQ